MRGFIWIADKPPIAATARGVAFRYDSASVRTVSMRDFLKWAESRVLGICY